jgi:tetratricopeptide (TPR) repeat protein
MTLFFTVIFAFLLFLYLAIPLLWPGQSDTLPDLRDPVTQDLEEERDALLRAIRELDARDDLPEARHDALRARYEAKTAKVLRALDERQEAAPAPLSPRKRRTLPFAALSVLLLALSGAAFLANSAVPDLAMADGATPLLNGRQLVRLERAVNRDPSEENLMALADGYWQVQNGEGAQAVYERVLDDIDPVPAIAYKRLGMLQIQLNVGRALYYLELARNADPQDLEVLYFLGEIYYANQDMAAAAEAWESYLATPGGADDAEVEGRLALARTYVPLLAAVARNPSEANLLALAESYWANQERGRAADYYFQLLSEKNPNNPTALRRIGQQLFFGGRNEDAIEMFSRARNMAPDDLQTLLFLGNAHFTLGQYHKAINVWQRYVQVAGGPERAGRVPSLIADARERLRSGAPPVAPKTPSEAGGPQNPESTPPGPLRQGSP